MNADEDEGESDEDEGPPPLLNDPDSDSDDTDNDNESLDDKNDDNEIAVVTDYFIAIETVKQSKQTFTKRDQLKAMLVRRFQNVSGFPSDETMLCSVGTNGIKKIPITRRDLSMTKEMLIPIKHDTQGKINRSKPDVV